MGIPVIRALHFHYSKAWGSILGQKTKIPQVIWLGQEWEIYIYIYIYIYMTLIMFQMWANLPHLTLLRIL